MQRLSGKKHQESTPIAQEIIEDSSWDKVEGFSTWFVYKISKYFSLGLFPIHSSVVKGRKLKARNKINLSKLSGKISVLDLSNICTVKGTLTDSVVIDLLKLKNTELNDSLWYLISKSKRLILHDVGINRFNEEYFNNITAIDILGSTVTQIGNRVVDLINIKRKRIRIADDKILIFYDENKCGICILKYFDVYRIIQRIPIIREIHFDSIEITVGIIKELRRHPITTVKMIGCRIQPIKLYDLVATCEKLSRIEFFRTPVALETVEFLRSKKITVIVT